MGTVEQCDGGVSRLLCYRIPALPWGRGGRELKAVAASCEPLWHLVPPWAGLRTGIGFPSIRGKRSMPVSWALGRSGNGVESG
jgi:hypothetical protein